MNFLLQKFSEHLSSNVLQLTILERSKIKQAFSPLNLESA